MYLFPFPAVSCAFKVAGRKHACIHGYYVLMAIAFRPEIMESTGMIREHFRRPLPWEYSDNPPMQLLPPPCSAKLFRE